MVQDVVGHHRHVLSAVLNQQFAVVEVGRESGVVRAGDSESQRVAGGDRVGSVPQTGSHLVHLIGLHHDRGEATFSPAHAHGTVLDQTDLTGGVHIGDAHHEVSVHGIGADEQVGEERTRHEDRLVLHGGLEEQNITALVNVDLVQRATGRM